MISSKRPLASSSPQGANEPSATRSHAAHITFSRPVIVIGESGEWVGLLFRFAAPEVIRNSPYLVTTVQNTVSNAPALLLHAATPAMARGTMAFGEKNLWTPHGTRTIHPVEPPAKWNWAHNHNVWPFASGLELEGRLEQGDFHGALRLLRACWGNMIDKGAECFRKMVDPRDGSFITHVPAADTGMDGDTWNSYAYGWSAGVGYLMQAYLLGVRALTPGFRRFLVSPRLEDLSHAQGQVPTPHGQIGTVVHREGGRPYATVDVPEGTEATVILDPSRPGRHCHAVDL